MGNPQISYFFYCQCSEFQLVSLEPDLKEMRDLHDIFVWGSLRKKKKKSQHFLEISKKFLLVLSSLSYHCLSQEHC